MYTLFAKNCRLVLRQSMSGWKLSGHYSTNPMNSYCTIFNGMYNGELIIGSHGRDRYIYFWIPDNQIIYLGDLRYGEIKNARGEAITARHSTIRMGSGRRA